MRTTLTLEDDLARQLQQRAHDAGLSFKRVVNDTLRAGLAAERQPRARRYRLRPACLGRVAAGVDLHKALRLADSLEDLEHERDIEGRK